MSHTRVKTTYSVESSYGSTETKTLYCHHNHYNDYTRFYQEDGSDTTMCFGEWETDNDLWDAMNRLWFPYKGEWGGELKDGVEYYIKAPWEIKNTPIIIGPFDGEYDFLSNFYMIDIEYNGIVFKSVEHAYQAMKATNFNDMMLVADANTPGQCKRIGRKITCRPDWDIAKFKIMKDLCRIKFKSPEMKKLLLNTDNNILIEINNWGDTIWGQVDGVGDNNLGKILMEIRSELHQ